MNITKDNQWRDGKALERYALIAPLLEGSLDPAKRLQMREDIASRNGISLRSLYRYEAAFKKEGFSGLKPAERPKQHSAKLPDNFKEILELEGWAPVGTLKRSTMQRHLYNAGFGDLAHTRSYSEDVAKAIDEEIRRIISECHDQAKKIILEHEDVLHKCASLLLEKEKVHRDEFEALFTTQNLETENNDI